MNEDGSKNGLKKEWSMLVHSFLEDSSIKENLIESLQQSRFQAEQLSELKKELSAKRKKYLQAVEKIKIKMDQVSMVIENLNLVGSDTSGLLKEIDFLNLEGEKISEQILLLDEKIKKLHQLQDLAI